MPYSFNTSWDLQRLGVCLKTAGRRNTPQAAAKRQFLRNSYVLWHVSYGWKPVRDSKIQHKYRYKIQTANMRKSVIRRKTPQDVTDHRKTVTLPNA